MPKPHRESPLPEKSMPETSHPSILTPRRTQNEHPRGTDTIVPLPSYASQQLQQDKDHSKPNPSPKKKNHNPNPSNPYPSPAPTGKCIPPAYSIPLPTLPTNSSPELSPSSLRLTTLCCSDPAPLPKSPRLNPVRSHESGDHAEIEVGVARCCC